MSLIIGACKGCGNIELERGEFHPYCNVCQKDVPLYDLRFIVSKDNADKLLSPAIVGEIAKLTSEWNEQNG